MEKLQAALENARKSRVDQPETRSAPTAPVAPSDIDARWLALETFHIDSKHLERNRVVTRESGPSATPFDILRTKVLLQMRQNGWRRLAITSPMPDSGKTTTACNLAMGLGRQRELRSILLDLDLRDPSVAPFFRAEPKHTIGRLLSGEVEFSEQAYRIGSNVAVSMGRHKEADPTRLLLAEETTEVIAKIERDYEPDLVIFDLPSVLLNDDTRAFLKNADCALMVIRANQTRYGQFDTCEREIAEHTNVLGVVLNAYMSQSQDNSGA